MKKAAKVDKPTNKVGRATNNIGDAGIESLFASKTLAALLREFMIASEREFYQSELARLQQVRLYSVQRELARLEKAGLILKSVHEDKRPYYHANREHPVFEDLKRIFLKTIAVGDWLREAIAPLGEKVSLAFIYGSYASGRETAKSDVDLLLVGNLTMRAAAKVFGPIRRELGRELNTAIYPPEEFRQKARQGHHFVRQVLSEPKIFLVGSEDELRKLVGRGSTARA